MRIAVTGATGFLGRDVIGRLLATGHEVRGWVHQRPGRDQPGLTWVSGSLDDPNAAMALVRGCDAVIHAALSRDDRPFLADPPDPVAFFETNVIGSLRLIQSSLDAGVKRFVFVSSGSVHEQPLTDRVLDETQPFSPKTLYGSSKASVETLVHAYACKSAMAINSIRPVAIYGINDPLDRSKWFELVEPMRRHEPIDISGGSKVVHVGDVSAAIELVLGLDDAIKGQTFNVCDRFVAKADVATYLKEITGSRSVFSGTAQAPGMEMRSDRIQSLGLRYGGWDRVRETLASLVTLSGQGTASTGSVR